MTPAIIELLRSLKFRETADGTMTGRVETVELVALDYPLGGIALHGITLTASGRLLEAEEVVSDCSSSQRIAQGIVAVYNAISAQMALADRTTDAPYDPNGPLFGLRGERLRHTEFELLSEQAVAFGRAFGTCVGTTALATHGVAVRFMPLRHHAVGLGVPWHVLLLKSAITTLWEARPALKTLIAYQLLGDVLRVLITPRRKLSVVTLSRTFQAMPGYMQCL